MPKFVPVQYNGVFVLATEIGTDNYHYYDIVQHKNIFGHLVGNILIVDLAI